MRVSIYLLIILGMTGIALAQIEGLFIDPNTGDIGVGLPGDILVNPNSGDAWLYQPFTQPLNPCK